MTDTSHDEDYIQLLSAVDQFRRDHDRDLERKSRKLLHEVENFRNQRQEDCVRFLRGVMPLIEEARKVDHEQDLYVAHRFNALRYLRNDELGLSRIIADLLDPSGEHGQSTAYLEALLKLLSDAPEGSDSPPSNTETALQSVLASTGNIQVRTERSTHCNRRIDITVDIPIKNDQYCLAIENKPYAGDLQDQCSHYLDFLEQEYHEHFLLVYLPPRKWMPSKFSLSDPKRWINHFCVLPYVASNESIDEDLCRDDSEPADSGEVSTKNQVETTDSEDDLSKFLVGDSASLADWFGTCSARSHAERLRWFLREAQLFCKQQFGNLRMTDSETRYIVEHLEKNPQLADSAYAVVRAWPDYMHGVSERFFEHFAENVRKELANKHEDLTVQWQYFRKGWRQGLGIYKESWHQYDGNLLNHLTAMRTAIVLECNETLNNSSWGVSRGKPSHNLSDEERTRQEKLENNLNLEGLAHSSPWWLHWEQPRHMNWHEIVPEIAQELEKGEGKITDYFCNGLSEFVDRTIRVIDKVEGPK